ncbi:chemotaxis protein [Halobacillus fulvus]|nr:chemotaxis protein [Halobacillus fulvus]
MTKKVAVLILHGIGSQVATFADEMIKELEERFAEATESSARDHISFAPVLWASVFAEDQTELWNRLKQRADLDYMTLRKFTVDFLADAIAYQPSSSKDNNYDKVHAELAQGIQKLEEEAGPDAPLCVICHSLGTVIASNYLYDLQVKKEVGARTRSLLSDSPLSRGETFTHFYTMGSPIALWSLRFKDFGLPIAVPSPKYQDYYSSVKGEWINFFDRDDILAYPLKGINEKYNQAVTEDVEVRAGGPVIGWTPVAHIGYSDNELVLKRIASGIVKLWRDVNE